MQKEGRNLCTRSGTQRAEKRRSLIIMTCHQLSTGLIVHQGSSLVARPLLVTCHPASTIIWATCLRPKKNKALGMFKRLGARRRDMSEATKAMEDSGLIWGLGLLQAPI
jgi:hypothetical protein